VPLNALQPGLVPTPAVDVFANGAPEVERCTDLPETLAPKRNPAQTTRRTFSRGSFLSSLVGLLHKKNHHFSWYKTGRRQVLITSRFDLLEYHALPVPSQGYFHPKPMCLCPKVVVIDCWVPVASCQCSIDKRKRIARQVRALAVTWTRCSPITSPPPLTSTRQALRWNQNKTSVPQSVSLLLAGGGCNGCCTV
jgi:hypothetical protein